MRSALLTAPLAATALAQGSGNPQSSRYTDSGTGISFTGFADGTGYQFGIAMPQQPTRDFIVQLVSPLTDRAGWAGIDFGASMTGPLMLVAWPNGADVVVAPRIATGYKPADTVPYAARALRLDPIAKGTFVNATHVSATFVCGGCIGADAFAAADTQVTWAFAYSALAVREPANPNSVLSTHVSKGEPYGSFDVSLVEAQSASYDVWAAMVNQKGSDAGQGGASAGAAQPSSSSSPASSTGGGDSGDDEDEDYGSISSGVIAVMALLGIVYMLQVVSSMC